MNRISPVAAGLMATLGLTLASLPVHAAIQGSLTRPIADLNNPCTPGHDSIDGVLNINYTIDRTAGGLPRLLISARGSGSDANGLFYRFLSTGVITFTDPLPAQVQLSVRLQPSGSSAGDARLGLFLLVDDRGRITDLGQSGLQCGFPA